MLFQLHLMRQHMNFRHQMSNSNPKDGAEDRQGQTLLVEIMVHRITIGMAIEGEVTTTVRMAVADLLSQCHNISIDIKLCFGYYLELFIPHYIPVQHQPRPLSNPHHLNSLPS